MSHEEVSEALDYDLGLVKAVALEAEAVEKPGRNLEELFPQSDIEVAKDTFVQICKFGENENARLRAAEFIIETSHGVRSEGGRKGNHLNISELNIQINQLREKLPIKKELLVEV